MKPFRNLNNESFRQIASFGSTGKQFEKTYKDGLTAKLFIPGSRITRKQIIDAFIDQENK